MDNSTVEKNLEKYETTESEKWDIIVGAMCELYFDKNDANIKYTRV